MGLNVDPIIVKPIIEGFINFKALGDFILFFLMILPYTHRISGEIMKVNILKNETQKEWTLCFLENLFFLEEFFCAIRCHYKSFPFNDLCFWHVINVSVNYLRCLLPLHTKSNIYGAHGKLVVPNLILSPNSYSLR